ncbi:hypothetical protein [Streptomyces sp. NRRL B-24484]|uniref:hypothetical protein n=1 Tax=Streptomyces sp. NRRL B-24484 TaxID=1463833 RepID=UPI000B163712|nr:hypothetical protein [Streptomyces sp. NRRL B-24484]
MRHLGTACFIVIAYLTGMRPGEVLGLRTGCCPDPPPEPDGTPGRHLVRGREFKTARDEDGNHLSRGTERALPWVAIAPVVNAIRVLERMVPDGHLLFDSRTHHFTSPRPATGSLTASSMVRRIEDFITWANAEAARHGLAREAIPPDPHGRVAGARFRRTLAWHIARRPGGLVALAIQYGHLRTAISAGHASRSRDGIHTLLDIETVRAVGDTATNLHQHLEYGGGISGPAARRAIQVAARAPEFAGTAITATTARRDLANDDLMIYDNPNTLLMCVYKRDQALCHRDTPPAAPAPPLSTAASPGVPTSPAPTSTPSTCATAPRPRPPGHPPARSARRPPHRYRRPLHRPRRPAPRRPPHPPSTNATASVPPLTAFSPALPSTPTVQ